MNQHLKHVVDLPKLLSGVKNDLIHNAIQAFRYNPSEYVGKLGELYRSINLERLARSSTEVDLFLEIFSLNPDFLSIIAGYLLVNHQLSDACGVDIVAYLPHLLHPLITHVRKSLTGINLDPAYVTERQELLDKLQQLSVAEV